MTSSLWCEIPYSLDFWYTSGSLAKTWKESPMLRDRYDPMDLFALVPALSLAMDPVLA